MRLKSPLSLLLAPALIAVAACGQSDTQSSSTKSPAPTEEPATTEAVTESVADKSAIDTVLAGAHREDSDRARDAFRHPAQTLAFFEVTPEKRVAELFPGGGWYTKVLAPYIATGNGTYIAVNSDPGDNERRQQGLQRFKDAHSDTSIYGNIQHNLVGTERPMAEAGTLDVVLTFRNVHNLMPGGNTEAFFANAYASLKPGGIFGVVEHRANTDVEQDPQARSGYVREDFVIAVAEKVGFEFDSKSEVNANPEDTKDHPFGVWTLPPVKRSAPRGETNPDFDRTKYDAIGESDRMTIKFRKPIGAEGALLE